MTEFFLFALSPFAIIAAYWFIVATIGAVALVPFAAWFVACCVFELFKACLPKRS